METLLVGLKHNKALQLLKDLEELNVIELFKAKDARQNNSDKTTKLSELKNRITSQMSNNEIDVQLQLMRSEWQRDI